MSNFSSGCPTVNCELIFATNQTSSTVDDDVFNTVVVWEPFSRCFSPWFKLSSTTSETTPAFPPSSYLSFLSLFLFCSWNFLNRHQKFPTEQNLLLSNPNLIQQTLASTIFFSAIYLIANALSQYLYPLWYKSLTNKKKGEVPSYALGLSHHLIIVPISIYFIYQDYLLPIEQFEEFNFFTSYAPLLPFTFGYFLADTFFYTFPELLSGRYAYFIHHIFAVFLLCGVSSASGPCVRAVPHFLLLELSSIFFGSAWMFRQIGFRGSFLVTIFENCFVLFYFLLRIVHLPIVILSLSDHLHTLGPFRVCVYGVLVLQLYWFYQIIQTLRVRDMGGGAKTKTTEGGDGGKSKEAIVEKGKKKREEENGNKLKGQ
jgi:hypothetical protein